MGRRVLTALDSKCEKNDRRRTARRGAAVAGPLVAGPLVAGRRSQQSEEESWQIDVPTTRQIESYKHFGRSRSLGALWLRLRTPAEIFVKHGQWSPRRLAPVARRHKEKVVRIPLYVHVDIYIDLSRGPVRHDIPKLRGFSPVSTVGQTHHRHYEFIVFVKIQVCRRSM
jgi:hypothetical protein